MSVCDRYAAIKTSSSKILYIPARRLTVHCTILTFVKVWLLTWNLQKRTITCSERGSWNETVVCHGYWRPYGRTASLCKYADQVTEELFVFFMCFHWTHLVIFVSCMDVQVSPCHQSRLCHRFDNYSTIPLSVSRNLIFHSSCHIRHKINGTGLAPDYWSRAQTWTLARFTSQHASYECKRYNVIKRSFKEKGIFFSFFNQHVSMNKSESRYRRSLSPPSRIYYKSQMNYFANKCIIQFTLLRQLHFSLVFLPLNDCLHLERS